MDSTVRIDCDEAFLANDTSWDLDVVDLERLHVSLPGEARCNGDEEGGAEYRCTACGEALSDQGTDGMIAVGGTVECRDSDSGDGPHLPRPVALAWLNSVAVHLDEEADEVTFTASVGDPRGAFAFRMRRGSDGRIVMSVPSPDDAVAHMPLHPLHSPATMVVG